MSNFIGGLLTAFLNWLFPGKDKAEELGALKQRDADRKEDLTLIEKANLAVEEHRKKERDEAPKPDPNNLDA